MNPLTPDTGLSVQTFWEKQASRWLGVVLGIALLFSVAVLAISSNRLLQGLDEAYHVVASANPWASPGWGVFFGFYLHPFWLLGQEHLYGFRLVGFVALTVFTLLFLVFFLRFLANIDLRLSFKSWIPAIGASFLIMAFSRYVVGMRTPNYDWVVLVGGMMLAAGWFAVETRAKPAFPFFPEALCAFGLLTGMMGKWTVVPGYIVVLGILGLWKEKAFHNRLRIVAGLIFWMIILGTGFVAYVRPESIEAVWRLGWIHLAIHSHDRAWTRLAIDLPKFCWTLLRALPFIGALYAMVWAWLFYFHHRKKPDFRQVAGLTFLLGLPLVALRGHFTGGGEYFAKGVMVTAIWFLGVLWMARPKVADFREEFGGPYGRAIFLLLALPLLNAVGTATSIVDYLGFGLIFPVAAAWLILLRANRFGLPSWCVAAAFLTIGVTHAARLTTSTFHVHRLGSAWGEVEKIGSGPEKGRFLQYPAAVRALDKISLAMGKEGFRIGDPVLGITDLPGLVYFLGGVSPGAAWYQSYRLPETYDGVRKILENIPPETLERCWVVFRENNKKSEALDLIWPRNSGVPIPVPLEGKFLWPWEPKQKQLEPVIVYRPAKQWAP